MAQNLKKTCHSIVQDMFFLKKELIKYILASIQFYKYSTFITVVHDSVS